MSSIKLPRPGLDFPGEGWRSRLEAFVANAAGEGLELEVHLGPPCAEAALSKLESSLGALPRDLRALVAAADGGRIGHLSLLSQKDMGPQTARIRRESNDAACFAFATDIAGGAYAAREGGPHAVFLVGEAGEHRFTTIGHFLEAALGRAQAAALHRKAEERRGDDLDDAPWLEAARALESEIDPGLLRTKVD